ncbi:MAG TPA: NmrA/HSCARG family protein [Gammaproteobacteria bacterium]|nr:NmrA/HSCARG family protein [Gammaproteobacteria bacterium]
MANKQNVERLILVTGATGKQGGAVARSLLDRGFRVRGLTRDPQKPDAQALDEQGAEVVQGDMEERSALERALEGAYGVFSVQNFWETGYDREVQQGNAVADAAKAAGVEHFVYSSVGSAHRQTGIPHFESKWEIEEHVRQIGLPYTILRPTFFMQNWEWTREMILGGTVAQPFDPDKPFQQVAVEDVGAFAAIAFENPDRWIGREVDLAGDEQSMTEIAKTFGRVIGRDVSYYQVPWDQFEEQMGEEATLNFRWINDVGYEADIAALRQEYHELTTFERYLRSHGWEGAKVPAGG